MERRTSIARVTAACVMLTLLVGLTACGSEPTPTPIGPVPTSTSAPLPSNTPPPTATPRPTPLPLRPNPLISTRLIDLGAVVRPLVSGIYCTPAWRSESFPASLAIPVEPVKGDVLLTWNSSGTSDYISMPKAPTYGLPASYTIATSADSTDGRDGTWREVVRVSDNTARTREHRFPLAGARWVRMTVTGAVPGPLGNMFAIDQIDLHDASSGTDDSIFFIGDSITAAAFKRCPAEQPSFAGLVHQAFPGWFPAMIDGGVGGVNSGYGVTVIQDWLKLNPDFHVWAIGYGTNDAWQKVPPATFEANLQAMVDRITAAGRVPVIARIPYATKGPADADVRSLNAVSDRVAARNGLIPGPDLYAWFKAHPDELGPDGVHPSDAGSRSINRLWYEALRPLYGTAP